MISRCVAMKIAVWFKQKFEQLLLLYFLVLFGQQHRLNVGQHTTSRNCDTTKELVQLFVVANGKLEMARYDPCFLIVTSSVSSQFQNLSRQVFQNSSQIDWCTGSNSVSIVAFPEKTVNSTDGKLKSSSTLGSVHRSITTIINDRFVTMTLPSFDIQTHKHKF